MVTFMKSKAGLSPGPSKSALTAQRWLVGGGPWRVGLGGGGSGEGAGPLLPDPRAHRAASWHHTPLPPCTMLCPSVYFQKNDPCKMHLSP